MTFFAAYLAVLAVFGTVDIIWLSVMAGVLYRPTLGPLLLDEIRWAPALLFYLGYPLGLVHFAVLPAFASGAPGAALVNGALLGLMTYATYDLTNYATLRAWTLQLTIADIGYGMIVAGSASWAACIALRRLSDGGWL